MIQLSIMTAQQSFVDVGFYVHSTLGTIEISGRSGKVTSIAFISDANVGIGSDEPYIQDCIDQIHEYFTGCRRSFTTPILFEGTEFEVTVWNTLLQIPYGETVSYKQIAEMIGSPDAVRAVGRANSRNSIAVIVPCHRVIGSDGHLTGYAGELWRKEWLLSFEKII